MINLFLINLSMTFKSWVSIEQHFFSHWNRISIDKEWLAVPVIRNKIVYKFYWNDYSSNWEKMPIERAFAEKSQWIWQGNSNSYYWLKSSGTHFVAENEIYSNLTQPHRWWVQFSVCGWDIKVGNWEQLRGMHKFYESSS